MSGQKPLSGAYEQTAEVALKHLTILRELLMKESFRQPNLQETLGTVARVLRDVLDARESMVALWNPSESTWSAMTSMGVYLRHRGVSAHGSRTILEQVRDTEEPILTSQKISMNDLQISSNSIDHIQIAGVLAVPFFWLDLVDGTVQKRFAGCLYAHRISGDRPFTSDDVSLVRDLALIVQPQFNVLHHLDSLELDLEATKAEALDLRKEAAENSRLGHLRSFDANFAARVLQPLQRTSQVDRVGLLLLGPTGSGKSHLARSYHYESVRREGPFVVLDCSQVTSMETLTAELFGYAPFSGYANAPQKGRLGKAQLADKGTLFLDEIACLSPTLQQQLLRLIETGTFSPLGSSKEVKVDVQIIAATLEDLTDLVRQKRFREDLFWRLSEVTIQLPALCQRAADIPMLAEHCLQKARSHYKRHEIKGFSSDAFARLQSFPWRQAGNIRGLGHTINRTVLLASPDTTVLTGEMLQFQQMFLESPASPLPVMSTASNASPPTDGSEAVVLPETDPLVEGPSVDAPDEEKHAFLVEKIHEYGGTLSEMAQDPSIARVLGYASSPIPYTSLRLKLQGFGLRELIARAREEHRGTNLTVETLVSAVREHGSGSAAAIALGLTRPALVWRLRKAGHTIRSILESP